MLCRRQEGRGLARCTAALGTSTSRAAGQSPGRASRPGSPCSTAPSAAIRGAGASWPTPEGSPSGMTAALSISRYIMLPAVTTRILCVQRCSGDHYWLRSKRVSRTASHSQGACERPGSILQDYPDSLTAIAQETLRWGYYCAVGCAPGFSASARLPGAVPAGAWPNCLPEQPGRSHSLRPPWRTDVAGAPPHLYSPEPLAGSWRPTDVLIARQRSTRLTQIILSIGPHQHVPLLISAALRYIARL